MDLQEKDQGVIAVLLKHFENDLYPRAQKLKEKVDHGAILNEQDLAYLDKVLSDAHQVMAIIERHPEYASLVKDFLLMYEDIMSKSQLNSSQP
ncbi:MAG: hypothetical protein JKX67_06735 [Colwellia sp.]|nr:hypothetical protein [Colwellia sp.]